ncbi:BspA family leucine-rich repeat surface protein, partial [Candidatus Marithrix sp. Canyon 246]
SGNAVADEVSSKAIYDSKFKTLSLDGILVPFIDEFTGKETDNKGIFDAQLQEKTKLVFELIPWSINFKNTFNGENTSGYILYDHNTRSVKIPCFEVTTIAKFGDGIQGESIYYKDVNMKQRHVAYPIFHVDNMTKTDSCENSVEPIQKPTLTTTPTTTKDDTVEVEVNGEDGTTVFVNGIDSGKTIDSTGKVKVTLDTSGDYGDKPFSISLKDSAGNESEALTFSITKPQIINFQFSYIGVYKPDANNIVEFIAQSDGLKPVDMTIKWDDNTIEKVEVAINGSKTISHTYSDNENKDIYMNGFVGVKNTKGKIQDVNRWGKETKFVYMREMFKMYEKTDWTATDTPHTRYVTNMTYMFSGNRSGKKISLNPNIGDWDVSNVTNMTSMFYQNIGFNQDISNWDVSNVVTMNTMFQVATSFNQDIGNWDVSNVTDMSYMFHVARSFNQDIGNWDVSKVTSMRTMFESTPFNQNIGNWDVSNVQQIGGMFSSTAFNQDISNWDVSNVVYMDYMFSGARYFNQDISKWNVSKVQNMYMMFRRANSFNQDISNWDVSNVRDMQWMFGGTTSFNQDISKWDVSNVNNMYSMFNGASFNQNIGNWNVSKVRSMKWMFRNAIFFNQDISNWDVSNVTDMALMFENANSFSNNDLSNWDVSKVSRRERFANNWGSGNTEPNWKN